MMDLFIQKVYASSYPGPDAAPAASAFDTLLKKVSDNVVTPIIYLLMSLAVLYFIWGMFVFIQNADNAEKRGEGYKHMIWGVVGLFIMVSARGIINLILNSLGLL